MLAIPAEILWELSLAGELGNEVSEHLEEVTDQDAGGEDDSALIQKLREELAAAKAKLDTTPLETGKVH